jgi:hypothetical protein
MNRFDSDTRISTNHKRVDIRVRSLYTPPIGTPSQRDSKTTPQQRPDGSATEAQHFGHRSLRPFLYPTFKIVEFHLQNRIILIHRILKYASQECFIL